MTSRDELSWEATRAGLLRIEPMTAEHAAQVLAIYQAGIDEGDATFETLAPSWADFDAVRLPGHRFVAVANQDGQHGQDLVVGWVAVTPVSRRPACAGV